MLASQVKVIALISIQFNSGVLGYPSLILQLISLVLGIMLFTATNIVIYLK